MKAQPRQRQTPNIRAIYEDDEGFLQGQILKILAQYPRVKAVRNNVGSAWLKGFIVKFGIIGSGDIFMVIAPHGTAAWIEVKRKGKKLEPDQIKFRDEWTAFGCKYWLVDSLDAMKPILEAIK